jgi:hypothetical protein
MRTSSITPLLHITLPDDDGADGLGEDRHFAPIVIALEAMVAINLWHIRRSLKRYHRGLGNPITPLYASGVRYKEDEPGREDWRDCLAVLQRGFGDCLPLSTLVLRDDYETVPIAALRPGDRILGDGTWTQVVENVVTGEKPILSFNLSNGCVLRCSPDHRIFRDVDGRLEEIRASEARIGDDLVTPTTAPLASSEGIEWPAQLAELSSADRAWLLGVFVADGWASSEGGVIHRSAISGLDGKPKEEQKRRVQTLLDSVGVTTRWHAKYIAINDRPISEFFATCGHLAQNKHLSSMRFASNADVTSVLEGLAADAGYAESGDQPKSTIVYGTTSPQLALQLRVLYRMLGISVSIRRVDNHGGFGEHPIYRVTPRLRTREGYAERREKKFARIRAIADGGVELCGDITTDSGKFWLPESDVLVHNCDQLVAWRAAELRAAGINAEPVIKWQNIPREMALQLGYPSRIVPPGGLSMVHCLVRWPDGRIEDPSKILGMGGQYTNRV